MEAALFHSQEGDGHSNSGRFGVDQNIKLKSETYGRNVGGTHYFSIAGINGEK